MHFKIYLKEEYFAVFIYRETDRNMLIRITFEVIPTARMITPVYDNSP